jgi:hypothetical protein
VDDWHPYPDHHPDCPVRALTRTPDAMQKRQRDAGVFSWLLFAHWEKTPQLLRLGNNS